MQISNTQWVGVVAGVAAALLVTGIIWFIPTKVEAPSSTSTSTPPVSATSTAPGTPAKVIYTGPFPVNSGETISSWTFKGSYADSDILIAQAKKDIAFLTDLLGKGKYDDYDLYNGRANDYTYLGDGTAAYKDYDRAIQIHPEKGIAYVNLANLMVELRAYRTAADAYARAVAVEPGMLQYHVQRLTYLTGQFPTDNARILEALTAVSKQFGDTSDILSIEAQWLAGQKRYADAIKAWQTVKMLSPANRAAAIDAEIARLQAKQ
ncbi:MAG: hypothetical protein WAV50_01990 [Minisyncoccia bacterium]